MAEGEAEEAAPAEEKKKGGMKKIVIMVVVFLLIGFVVAKKTVLKPPPPTAAQVAATAAVETNTLEIKCADVNNKTPPAVLTMEKALANAATEEDEGSGEEHASEEPAEEGPGDEHAAEGAEAEHEAAGPTILLEPVTVNLADGHFLKMSIGLQLPHGALMEELEEHNPGTAALDYIIEQMRQKTMKDLGPKALAPLKDDLGYHICVTPKLNAEGQITTIYFTEFVAQ